METEVESVIKKEIKKFKRQALKSLHNTKVEDLEYLQTHLKDFSKRLDKIIEAKKTINRNRSNTIEIGLIKH